MNPTGQGRRLAGRYEPAAKLAPKGSGSIVEMSIEGGLGVGSVP